MAICVCIRAIRAVPHCVTLGNVSLFVSVCHSHNTYCSIEPFEMNIGSLFYLSCHNNKLAVLKIITIMNGNQTE